MRTLIKTLLASALALGFVTHDAQAGPDGRSALRSAGKDRVIGGVDVKSNTDAAWAIVLKLDNRFHCGGSLVFPEKVNESVVWHSGREDPRWVITAAHCLYDHDGQRITADRLSVQSGTLNLFNTNDQGQAQEGKGQVQQVKFIMEHDNYHAPTTLNDVALLYLSQAPNNLDVRKRASIGLPEGQEISWAYAPYTQVHPQGWGAVATTNLAQNGKSEILQETRVPIIDHETCARNYGLRGKQISPGMICAGYARGQYDSCWGDSGGPLAYRPQNNPSYDNTFLTGVVSWGIGCALADLPGVYSSTTFYRPWFEATFIKCQEDFNTADCTRRTTGNKNALVQRASANMITGAIDLRPEGCETTGLCKLGSPLRFVQLNGTAWQSDVWTSDEKQSGTTDGASIPKWAQPVIGKPFDRSYLKAAILHDHYCYRENHVRSWRDTHRMFRDALLASGLSRAKANTMFYAVLLGGPRWKKLVPGENCGPLCVKNVARVGKGKGKEWKDAVYETDAFTQALDRFQNEDAADGLDDAGIIARAEQDRKVFTDDAN